MCLSQGSFSSVWGSRHILRQALQGPCAERNAVRQILLSLKQVEAGLSRNGERIRHGSRTSKCNAASCSAVRFLYRRNIDFACRDSQGCNLTCCHAPFITARQREAKLIAISCGRLSAQPLQPPTRDFKQRQ